MTTTFSTSIRCKEKEIELTVSSNSLVFKIEYSPMVVYTLPRIKVNQLVLRNFINGVNPYFTVGQVGRCTRFELRDNKLYFVTQENMETWQVELTPEQKEETYSTLKAILALMPET